nr:MAG TPA: hypothetical protein [Caudoviricetes sp.]
MARVFRTYQVTLYPLDLRPFFRYTKDINKRKGEKHHEVLHLNRPLDRIRVPA